MYVTRENTFTLHARETDDIMKWKDIKDLVSVTSTHANENWEVVFNEKPITKMEVCYNENTGKYFIFIS